MYHTIYYFLRDHLPIVLHRPFLFSSIYPIVLSPVFGALERNFPGWFVQRGGINKQLDNQNLYHLFTFICLCLCSLIDPYTFSFSLRELPQEPPHFLWFAVQTIFLTMLYEVELSLLHILFHRNKWLFLYSLEHRWPQVMLLLAI